MNFTANKKISLINLFYFLGLMIIAVFFGEERVLFRDGSVAIEMMVNDGILPVVDNRYPAAFNHLFTYIASFLNFDLGTLIHISSINYILLPVIVFIALRYKQNGNLKYELVFLTALTIFNTHTYFYPIHDYWFGFYLFFFFYRALDEDQFFKSRTRYYVVNGLLLTIIVFSHLNTVFSVFIILFYLFHNNRIDKSKFYGLFMVLIANVLIKLLFFSTSYESFVLSPEMGHFTFPEFFQTRTVGELGSTLINKNLNFLLLIVLIALYSIKSKNITGISFVIFEFVISILVINTLFPHHGYAIYTEGYFKSLNIIVAVVFVNMMLTYRLNPLVFIFILLLNFSFSIRNLLNSGSMFATRYEAIKEISGNLQSNTLFNSEQDVCPYLFIPFFTESKIINLIENDKEYYFSAIVRDDDFTQYYFNSLRSRYSSERYTLRYDSDYIIVNSNDSDIDFDSFSLDNAGYNCVDFVRLVIPPTNTEQ